MALARQDEAHPLLALVLNSRDGGGFTTSASSSSLSQASESRSRRAIHGYPSTHSQPLRIAKGNTS